MQSDIVLFDNSINLFDKYKTELIDQNCTLNIDILLVINILLTIDKIKKILQFNFISAVRCWNKKTVYINKILSFKIFDQRKINFIFEIDCNLWIQKLAQYKFLLISDIVQSEQLLFFDLDIFSKTRNIAETIQAAESILVSIDNYSDI